MGTFRPTAKFDAPFALDPRKKPAGTMTSSTHRSTRFIREYSKLQKERGGGFLPEVTLYL